MHRLDPRSVPAKFPGQCPQCGEAIEVGQHISMGSHERWVHQECGASITAALEAEQARLRRRIEEHRGAVRTYETSR